MQGAKKAVWRDGDIENRQYRKGYVVGKYNCKQGRFAKIRGFHETAIWNQDVKY